MLKIANIKKEAYIAVYQNFNNMLQINISETEIQTLNYERFYYPCPIVQKRFHIIYLKSRQFSHSDISKILDVHINTVSNCIKTYNTGGIQLLKQVAYGTNYSKLDKHKGLEEYFKNNYIHTVNEAVEYIERTTGIKRSPTAVRNFLHRLGLKPRKTGHIPAKADVQQQELFLNDTLEPLIVKAKNDECILLFLDAAHFVLGVFLTVLWSIKRIFLAAPAGRQRLNVLGALNPITMKISVLLNTTYVDAQVIATFFRQLAEEYAGKPIYIVLDNARYQHCKYIEELSKSLNIHLKFLPPYSPNLNLIERLWKFTKKKVLYAKYYDNFQKFQTAIYNCLNDCNTIYKKELKTLLSLNFQTFKNSQIYTA